ncbi:hypothetical protein QTP88_015799 [Uroleucon formosanum]
MIIVIVRQVQSAKVIKSVAKTTPATSQLMVKEDLIKFDPFTQHSINISSKYNGKIHNLTSSEVRYQLHESTSRAMVMPPRHNHNYTMGERSHCIKGRSDASFRHNAIFFSLFSSKKPTKKPKMGAEKVTMNIVVVGQVQSAKTIKSVAKATPATSQLMQMSNLS